VKDNYSSLIDSFIPPKTSKASDLHCRKGALPVLPKPSACEKTQSGIQNISNALERLYFKEIEAPIPNEDSEAPNDSIINNEKESNPQSAEKIGSVSNVEDTSESEAHLINGGDRSLPVCLQEEIDNRIPPVEESKEKLKYEEVLAVNETAYTARPNSTNGCKAMYFNI
jgi:hypothetical protein